MRDQCGTPLIELDRLLRRMHFQAEPELVMVTDYYEPRSEPEGECVLEVRRPRVKLP